MLTNIKSSVTASASEEDAITLLLGCHQRIRHFTEVALRLAEDSQASGQDRADAAEAVFRYYTVALPLHEADENDSIYPRLHKALPPGVLAEANESMVAQHQTIDALVAKLVPAWKEMVHTSSQRTESGSLLDDTQNLHNAWTSHLQLEEEQVIPAMRKYLPPGELKTIQGEMRARRETAQS